MGLIGNIAGFISFSLHKNLKTPENNFEKRSIRISYFIGLIMFAIMGMFLASFVLSLSKYTSMWLAIPLGLLFVLLVYYYSGKEAKEIAKRRINRTVNDFNNLSLDEVKMNTYRKHSTIVNQNVLYGSISLIPSYIIFLVFNRLADTLSFGLNSYLLSLI